MPNQNTIRTYTGSQERATKEFREDAKYLARQGYMPTSQSWAPGTYGCGSFFLALILCFVLIGIFIFIYMLIVKPEGTLTVTYEKKEEALPPLLVENAPEKTCPQCAENVKVAAKVCRFCGHMFEA